MFLSVCVFFSWPLSFINKRIIYVCVQPVELLVPFSVKISKALPDLSVKDLVSHHLVSILCVRVSKLPWCFPTLQWLVSNSAAL